MYSVTLQTTDNIVTSGERIGQIQFAASNESDGSAAISVAGSVYCQAEGSFQSASNPTSLVLATAAADASAAVGRIKVTDNGSILPMSDAAYDLGNSNLQFKNQYISEGIVLSSNTPSSTTNKLYNEGGTLKFNGSSLGGGGGISAVVEDTTPQLGGDLDAQTNKITFTDGNVTIGDTVTAASTAATGNVIIGQRAGATGLGRDNIAIGHQSLNSTAGNNDIFNIGIGYNSLQNADGNYNVCLGTYAGQGAGGFYGGSQRRATKNICIGYYAGKDVLGNNNIEISPYNTSTSRLGAVNFNDYLNIGHTIFADMANRRVNIGLIGSLSSWAIQSDAALYVGSNAATDVGLIVQGAISQTADFAQFQNSSATVRSHIDSATRTIYDVDTILSTPSTKGIGPYGKSVSIFSQNDGSITAQFIYDDVGNHYTALNAPELRLFNGTTYLQSLRDGLFGADDGGLAIYDSDGTTSGILQCGAIKTPIKSNTDGATVTFDMDVSNLHTVTLAGNRTLAVSNVDGGQRFIIRLVQDNTGTRTVTWWSGINWPGGLEPSLTNTANAVDVFGFIATAGGNYDGFVIGYDL